MTNPTITVGGTRYWHNKHQLHREDGPAIVWENGSQAWHKNGKIHRTDGPAFINEDGYQEWWINGKRYVNNKSFQKAANLSDEDMIAIVLKYGNVK